MKTRRTGARISLILEPLHGEPGNVKPWDEEVTREQIADAVAYALGQEGYHVKDVRVTWTRK